LKYWPSSRDFNKLVIKAKMHANTYFLKFSLLYENTIWFFIIIFERLGRMHEKKIFYFFNFVLTKTIYFNTGFVSIQYKNTNQYCAKLIKKIYIYMGISRIFLKRFLKFFDLIFLIFFGLGPARPMWLG
jgi:hypothetical protein